MSTNVIVYLEVMSTVLYKLLIAESAEGLSARKGQNLPERDSKRPDVTLGRELALKNEKYRKSLRIRDERMEQLRKRFLPLGHRDKYWIHNVTSENITIHQHYGRLLLCSFVLTRRTDSQAIQRMGSSAWPSTL